ncbi:sensor histidine kinase KdpD [Haloarchaeobius sp. HME9146]|uniref:sensor histidine kinase n=1 Tax=Haloarchaeobius sp. HME9146 TaxID=2978732 RepID=UPI0021BF0DE8|nr:HAMP domain-containing sensor histidine kinase [Haloarchaeobius sp. HME9146]MCT9095216.1 HAMP domain-containing histidine kinase [Haloarchaeobius sp. HME9146]
MHRAALERYRSVPVFLLGGLYLLAAFVHLVWHRDSLVSTVGESGLLAVLAGCLIYGANRLSRLQLGLGDSFRVFSWTVASAGVGLVVAAVLISMQQLDGVPIQNVPVLLLNASAATAVIGLAVTEYRERLLDEQETLRSQKAAVDRLNRRVTVLNRVLRHDLRNETTIIRGYTDLLVDSVDDAEAVEALERVRAHSENVERLSGQAKRLNRVWEDADSTAIDLVDVVAQSVDAMSSAHGTTAVTTELPASAPAMVHPQFSFAVTEAIDNAIRHNDPSTTVVVSVEHPDREHVMVRVANTGSGIPDNEVAAIRDGTEDALVHCSGLGLWLLFWTVTLSDGTLTFRENEPHGTVVERVVPAADAARR